MLIYCIVNGVAVGDALGFPVQFEPRSQRRKSPVVGMGKYKDEDGQIRSFSEELTGLWSDDTSLTLCLAESLLNGFDLKNQAERFVAWLDKGYLSARYRAFDVGLQTTESIARVRAILESGHYTELEHLASDADEYSNGNGSLMRILPLVLYIKGMPTQQQFDLVRKASALTHPHIRSAICCFYYLKMAEYIVDGLDKNNAYSQARMETNTLMKQINCPEKEFDILHRLLEVDIGSLSEDEIDSGSYVVSTLEASIWCLLTTDTYPEAVLKAVNLGDDSDTTGAITGGLAALLYGYEAIPKEWIGKLKKPELIEDIVNRWQNR
ncbi:MAG: ADP-ribosylglycohydrolase family protein [Candidatus Cloacimonas sp.]